MAFGFTPKLQSIIETPVIKIPVYECNHCDTQLHSETMLCPNCDEPVTQTGEEPIPIIWQ